MSRIEASREDRDDERKLTPEDYGYYDMSEHLHPADDVEFSRGCAGCFWFAVAAVAVACALLLWRWVASTGGTR